MISIGDIQQQFPGRIRDQPQYFEYMLKEYFQYKMLDIIFRTKWAPKLSFIGGTSIRIIHNVERFSEDLDFDTFNLSREEFFELTDEVLKRIKNEGVEVSADDKEKDLSLNAFRRNITFPGLLYNLSISGHKEKRFLIKIESEPHHFNYVPGKPVIQKFNILTQVNAAPVDVLLSMKIGAALERQKGRDYYDCMYLMGKTEPNWEYLTLKFNIGSAVELKGRLLDSCKNVDFTHKSEEFGKLIFNPDEAIKVKLFPEYIKQKKFADSK
ncbi:nucleotidyl transferase AbiEii/AbiGii toxin family protein [Bacteroidota bacterium]